MPRPGPMPHLDLGRPLPPSPSSAADPEDAEAVAEAAEAAVPSPRRRRKRGTMGVSPRASAARAAARRRYLLEMSEPPVPAPTPGGGGEVNGEGDGGDAEAEASLLRDVEASFRVGPSPAASSPSAPRPRCRGVSFTFGEGSDAAPSVVPETATATAGASVVPETASLGGTAPESAQVVPKAEPADEEGTDVPSSVPAAASEEGDAAAAGDTGEAGYGAAGADEEYQPREPSCERADALSFAKLCHRLERVWAQRKRRSNKQPRDALLEYLLPGKLLGDYMAGTSPFPLLRLIMPDLDTSRPHNGMKEKSIARSWAEALGLARGSPPYEKLLNFTDPTAAGPSATGDLSVAVKEVVERRCEGRGGSSVTVGKMNRLLDELANIKNSAGQSQSGGSQHYGRSAQHDWRESQGQSNSQSQTVSGGRRRGGSDFMRKMKQRERWVAQLIGLNLSPVEHKWVVRILLQKLELGVGWKVILRHYHRWAEELYSSNNSLKRLCQTLSDPEWVRRREERERRAEEEERDHNRKAHLPRSHIGATLGNTIAPMLAARTSFATALTDIGARHRAYRETLPEDDPEFSSLALKFPTFMCEVKLDGERMVVHVERGGAVRMQTRNATWYSKLYSPVLGPPLRRSLAAHDVDVILDGEVVAWDDARGENIPFGSNRTVAKARTEWMRRRGLLDDRDVDPHDDDDDDDDRNVMSHSLFEPFDRRRGESGGTLNSNPEADGDDDGDAGRDCWLKLVVFDVLYVRGPGASGLLEESCRPLDPDFDPARFASGSVIDLDGFMRKSILYRLLDPQENEVVPVESVVVRSDGQFSVAREYFSPRATDDDGHRPPVLDSIECAKSGLLTNRAEVDDRRRDGRTDEQIERERAHALERLYGEVVERQFQEGLMFKDLASPYLFGDQSRSMRYWFKLKADYGASGHASDVDVAVLGAYWATGMGRAGLLSHFVVGCIDGESSSGEGKPKFMTLGKVSGGGTKRQNLERLLEITGFCAATSTSGVDHGKWFRLDRTVPDFVSQRSFQRSMNGDSDGWKFIRDKYPDAWIRPEDSFVLTINAGEIVSSDEWSAGVTLRFPRINKIRAEGFGDDPKSVYEVETAESLQQLYFDRQQQISETSRETLGSQGSHIALTAASVSASECRFLTAEQNAKKRSSRRTQTAAAPEVMASRIPTPPSSKASKILHGCTFTILEGTYHLDEDDLDMREAREHGWQEDVAPIRCRDDFIRFIQRHSGECVLTGNTSTDFIVGGRIDDARVANYRRAIEAASLDDMNDKSKKGKNLRKMIHLGGVVKWTFVVAAFHKMLDEIQKQKMEEDADDVGEMGLRSDLCNHSIKDYAPNLLRPRRYDFLVLSKVAEDTLLTTEDKYGIHLWEDSNEIDFKRALEEVGRDKHKAEMESQKRDCAIASLRRACPASNMLPWQYNAVSSLEENDRWVFSGKRQKLWPYGDGFSVAQPAGFSHCVVVLYPDLFGDDLGFEDAKQALEDTNSAAKSSRWNCVSPSSEFGVISSSLPLVKAMGAHVTPHLHNEVTHILCEMTKTDVVEWKPAVPLTLFAREESCRSLHSRLLSLAEKFASFGNGGIVMLVSPQWVKKKWNEV